MTLPNLISTARVLLVPAVMALILAGFDGHERWAAAVYLVAALSDSLDGYLARRQGWITVTGTFLDPLADKLLVSAALISLVELNRLAAWVAMVIIAREFSVTGLRLIAAAENVVIAASPWGKVKTTFQVAAIIALILDDPPHAVTTVLVACAVAATIWSGIEYFISARDLLRAPA
jgi:CDP-diacylglycerol---glycerol-3-phosphate 3-phosphatidyltransferase